MLVVESCQGMVVGALLDRMGGYGSLIQVYAGDFPGRQALEYFNFPKHFMKCLSGFAMDKVTTLGDSTGAVKKPLSESDDTREKDLALPDDIPEGNDSSSGEEEYGNAMTEEEKLTRRLRRQSEESQARAELERGNLDSLVVVSRFQPSPIVMALLPRLAPSRPFVVYCQYKEPLMECYVNLREKGTAINILLTETWWRHYQVLPARTHPEIAMNSTGGYLLSGITVEPETTPNIEAEPQAKKLKLDECG